jgi:taurine dioxygenase
VFTATKYRTAHPVVRVHPESGERNLLQAYVTRPENIFRVQWQPGDLVLFDNRITQHYAPDDYGDLPRLLHRVTVAGDAPVGIEGKESYILEGDEASHYTPVATG